MIDWSRPVQSSHALPKRGHVLPPCPVHGKRRVFFPQKPEDFGKHDASGTTYRYFEDGRNFADRSDDWDVRNVEAA